MLLTGDQLFWVEELMVSACGARYEAGWDAESHKTTTGSKTKTKQTTKKHMCRHFCLRLRLRLCVLLRRQFARPSGQGRVRSPLSLVIIIFMGSPPLSPMVDIWGINLKGRNASPSNHDHSYGTGVLTLIGTFRRPPVTSTLRTIVFHEREQE